MNASGSLLPIDGCIRPRMCYLHSAGNLLRRLLHVARLTQLFKDGSEQDKCYRYLRKPNRLGSDGDGL